METKKNKGRYITQDELKKAFAKCSVNEITEAMGKDPMIGLLILMVTGKICAELEHKLFDEHKDNDKKEVKE